jgi:D-alanine-D-alanine ligase
MAKQTIALLSGGISPEREVSLNSGDQVYEALDKEKYDIIRYDPKTDLPRLVEDAPRIDAALIILHGPYGEDGTVQGMLDLLDIPYQGSGVLGSAAAMNKLVAKQLYEKSGIPVPDYLALTSKDTVRAEVFVGRFGLPLVVKPVIGGSSIGTSLVKSIDEFEPAIVSAFEHDDTILIERYIEGVELTVGVIGNDSLEALPVIEIIPEKGHEFFDFTAKYTAGVAREICPARITDSIAETAQTYAKMAHRALFCRGYSRTDMFLAKGGLFVLETNTIPGMTPGSLLPLAARTAGIDFGRLLEKLIALGIESHKNRKNAS